MIRTWIGALACLALGLSPVACSAEPAAVVTSEQAKFRVVEVAKGFDYPWSIEFLPDGDMLVAERNGTLKRVTPQGASTALTGVPAAFQERQGGYFDVVLHPQYAQNGLIYFAYAAGTADANGTVLARAKFQGTALTGVQTLFSASPTKKGGLHFGGRIIFLKDGTLMLSLGEGGRYKEDAQNLNGHFGKIVRLKDDGTVPADNPFFGQQGAKPEIWSYGHRNVQGLALRPGTDQIWANEHGPKGGDELNLIQKGRNYGWPVITYGINYDGSIITNETARPGMEQPVVKWVPSIAPSSLAFYDGDKFPAWKGDAFVSALVLQHVRRIEFKGDQVTGQEELLTSMGERFRDVAEGPDGLIYLLTDSDEGRIVRLEPAS